MPLACWQGSDRIKEENGKMAKKQDDKRYISRITPVLFTSRSVHANGWRFFKETRFSYRPKVLPTANTIAEDKLPEKFGEKQEPRIVIPRTPTRRGAAFEYLILSYYDSFTAVNVEKWSSCIYGRSGKLYQCDGIIHDGIKRYLMEAKFIISRPVSIRDIVPPRREEAAEEIGCDGIVCVSVSGFDDSVKRWQKQSNKEILLVEWSQLRNHVLASITGLSTVLLDTFQLVDNIATSYTGSQLLFDEPPKGKPLENFTEFISYDNNIELWLRRLPNLSICRHQFASGKFVYSQEKETVELVQSRKSDISLFEAWEIEDQSLGYSARVYNALKATAKALAECDNSDIRKIRNQLRKFGWKTGQKGVRKALDDLILLGFVSKYKDGRIVNYKLTSLGYAFVKIPDKSDEIFVRQLYSWKPYEALRKALNSGKVCAKREEVIEYFRDQFYPYEPYVRCPFNDNTTDGLLSLFKIFG